jgi:hypothetical protein
LTQWAIGWIFADTTVERPMMPILNRIPAFALVSMLAAPLPAQAAADCPAIAGDWSGVSACVDRSAAPGCAEERVRFHVRATAPDRLRLSAEKLAGDRYVAMGDAEIVCDARSRGWRSTLSAPQFTGAWSYWLEGDRLVAELRVMPAQSLIRRVELHRG